MANRKVSITISAEDRFSDVFSEYNRKLGNANDANAKAQKQAGKTKTAFSSLGTAVGGAIAAYGAMEAIRVVADLTVQGLAADRTAAKFDALTASIGGPDGMLATLQEVTNNTVTDNDLMAGANQLLQMGLAESTEEVSDFIEMALALRKPTVDAGDAIDDFSKLLANQSVLRLDNFGISSGRVRSRINELLASGQALNREEAFKMATLEQGAIAMDRLGDATAIADTATERLVTRLGNLRTELSQTTADMVEHGARSIEFGEQMFAHAGQNIAENLGLDEATQVARQEARNTVDAYVDEFTSTIDNNPALRDRQMTKLIEEAIADPMRNAAAIVDASGALGFGASHDTRADAIALVETVLEGEREILAVQEQQAAVAAAAASSDRALLNSAQMQVAVNEQNLAIQQRLQGMRFREGGNQAFLSAQRQAQVMLQEQLATQRELDRLTGSSNAALAGASSVNIGQFFDPADVAQMEQFADDAERALGAAKDMGLEGDALSGFQSAAEETRKIADQAQRAADEFERASLSDIFGQTGGGRSGEISDLIAASLEASGASEEDIAAFQAQADLQSGRETASSQAFDAFVSDLPNLVSLEDLPLAIQNLNENLDALALAGADTTNLDENNFAQMAGIGLDGSVMAGGVPMMPVTPSQPANMGMFPQLPGEGQLAGAIDGQFTDGEGEEGEEGGGAIEATRLAIEEISEAINEIIAPDFSPEAWKLDLSSDTIDDITAKLEDIDGRVYSAEVKIKVTQEGGSMGTAQITGSIQGSSNDVSE